MEHQGKFEKNTGAADVYRFTCRCGAWTIGPLEECKVYALNHYKQWVEINPETNQPIEAGQ
ncbi:MAG: hypothetical protein KGL39_12290 [Patescibacteria group bacterium]|nr:hypothetical protein [Patescibacteria group bacterium]